MALVNQVQKRVKMPKWDIVKFQILTHCYINKIAMSESDLNCLTLLSFNQPIELTHFCYDTSTDEDWIFKSSQTVRNCINKAEKNKLDVIQVATAINNFEEVMKPAAPKVRRKGPVKKY